MGYRLSVIFRSAWAMFKNEEHFGFETFGQALKQAWKEEKEFVDSKKANEKDAAKSDEVKAWNWAEKKLGVKFDLTSIEKQRDVNDVTRQFQFSKSIWACAMQAVKLHIQNEKVIAALGI